MCLHLPKPTWLDNILLKFKSSVLIVGTWHGLEWNDLILNQERQEIKEQRSIQYIYPFFMS